MNVVIFGATSRIAQALARRWAARGARLVVLARDLEEAGRIADDARVRDGVVASAKAFDARAFDTHEPLVRALAAELGRIDVGVVAFGDMGDPGGDGGFEDARKVMETNYLGAASLSEALVRVMAEQGGGGTVVGLSSVAGERGRKSNYVYGSAKGAYSLFLEGLRGRAFEHGVHVLTVKLGFIDTRMTFGLGGRIPIASPEDAAAAILSAAEHHAEEIYYPRFWRPIMAAIRAIPPQLMKRLSI